MKKANRILSLLLAVTLIFGTLPPLTVQAANPNWQDPGVPDTAWYTEQTAAGKGGEADPYVIDAAAELAGLASLVNSGAANFPNKYIRLDADIDMSGRDWTPIGNNNYFTGNFDGNGYIIKNLTRYAEAWEGFGLFGRINVNSASSSIKNLGVVDVNVGGSVTLFGAIASTIVVDGYQKDVTIENCFSTGNINSSAKFGHHGGLIGSVTLINAMDSSMVIRNCYSACNISLTTNEGSGYTRFAGGLISRVEHYGGTDVALSITNSYSASRLSTSNTDGSIMGGFIGYVNTTSQINMDNCLFDTQAAGMGYGFDGTSASFDGVQGRLTSEMTGTGALPAPWDSSAWSAQSDLYPQLDVFGGSDSSLASTIPVFLFENAAIPALSDTTASIRHSFRVPVPSGVTWSAEPSGILAVDGSGNVTFTSPAEDTSVTLTAQLASGAKMEHILLCKSGIVAGDTTPPVITLGTITTSDYSASIDVASNESADIYVLVRPAGDAAPGVGEIVSDSRTERGNGMNFTAAIGGLQHSTNYIAYAVGIDTSGNVSAVKSSTFATLPDQTPPLFISHSNVRISGGTAAFDYSFNESGTVYYVILSGNQPMPSKEQIADGKDASGNPAEHYYNDNYPTAGAWSTINIDIEDFAPAVYSIYMICVDGFGNKSDVLKITDFSSTGSFEIKGTVTFTITDGTSPIAGANVKIGTETILTDADGKAAFTLSGGSHSYKVSKTGYQNTTGIFAVDSKIISKEVALTVLGEGFRIFTFTVQDGSVPLTTARVTIGSETKTVDASGQVAFYLKDGSYDYTVSAMEYITKTGSISVSGGDGAEAVTLELDPAKITINITNHETGKLADEIAAYLSSSGIPGRYEKIGSIKVSGGELNYDDWDFFYNYYDMPVETIDLSGTYSRGIPDYTFGYYNMSDISLPTGIESIGAAAFENCFNMTNISLSESIKSIGEYAFEECENLTDITILSSTPPTVGADAFYGIPSTAVVRVPAGSAAAYKAVDDGDTTDDLWYGLMIVAGGLTDAEINPASVSFDLADPQDISTTITWNGATVVDAVYGSGSLDEGMDYTIDSDILTIKQEYLLGLNPSAGDSIDFDISFDVGEDAALTVDIVNGHSITTGSISGTVTDGTGPVYGAVVCLTVTESVYSDVTVADGSYTILNIPAGTDYMVTASKTGYISGSMSGVTVKAAETTSGVNITLSHIQQTYTVTFNSQGGSAVSAITGISSGSTISAPAAPTRSGYTFKGWYKEAACTNAWNFSTDKVTGNITLYAGWSARTNNDDEDSSGSGGSNDSGSGGSGSGTTIVSIQPGNNPDQPTVARFSVTPRVDNNGHATVTIPEGSVADAIAKALAYAKAQGKTANGIGIALNIDLPDTAKSLGIVLPQATLKNLVEAGVRHLEINGVIVYLNLDLEALREIRKQSTGDVTITLKPVQNLSAAARKLIGTRPVYDMTITCVKDGKTVTISSLNKGRATLSIPYTPNKNEAVDYLFGVYVDGSGNPIRIDGSTYDTNSRSIIFGTNHFSVYGVGYQSPSEKFTDITTHWAKESIDYVVGQGLFSGTSDTIFSPDTAMSRGMLVTVLGRLAGADVSSYKTSSFTDVKKDSYYLPYIEWAYKKGIVGGIGNNQFAPDKAITREEIAVIMQNYSKATGYTLPVTCEAIAFADKVSISSFAKDAVKAMQQAGIMNGKSNGYFEPKGTATRAEVAATLHRYIKR